MTTSKPGHTTGIRSLPSARPKIVSERPFASPLKVADPRIVAAVGVDPATGRLFGSDRTYGAWAQSVDQGVTWTYGAAPDGVTGNSLRRMVAFDGDVYAMAVETATTLVGLYKSAGQADAANWSWSTVIDQQPDGCTTIPTGLEAGSEYLFFSEYGDEAKLHALGGPRLRRSADGATWETVWGRSIGTKHIHGVFEDPYNPGHIYMTLGDNVTADSVMRSTEHGAAGTWKAIIVAATNGWQSVQMSFCEDWVWMAADRYGLSVTVFDRDECVPYAAATNYPWMTAVPGGAEGDRFYEFGYYGAVDPDSGVYYHNQSDTSTGGNTFANFVMSEVGGRLELLDINPGDGMWSGNGRVYILGDYVWIGNCRYPKWRIRQ